MSVSVTCDKCGKDIGGDFVRVRSDFYTLNADAVDFIEWCADGDRFTLCDKCYEETFRKAVGE